MHKTVFLVIIFLLNLSAQDLYKVYEKILPSLAVDSDIERKEVSNTLHNLGRYNPELIYYYIEYLRISSQDSHDRLQAKQYLSDKSNEFYSKMSLWKERELKILSSMNLSDAQWLKIWTYYFYIHSGNTASESASETKPVYLVSSSYRDYVVFLFYSGKFSEYEGGINYAALTKELLEPVRTDLTYVFYNPDKFTDTELDEYYEIARSNPFIFKESILDYVNDPVPVYLSEFLAKISGRHFTESTRFFAGAGLGLTKIVIQNKVPYTDNPDLAVSLICSNANRTIPSLSFGAMIKLRETKRTFSSINMDISVGYNKFSSPARTELSDGRTDFIVRYGIYGMRVDPNYETSGDYSNLAFIFRASTPLIYITSSNSLEAGIYGRYSLWNYNFIISRNDKYVSPSSSYPQSMLVSYENKNFNFSEKKISVLPWFALNSLLNDYFILRVSGTAEYFPQVDLLYRF